MGKRATLTPKAGNNYNKGIVMKDFNDFGGVSWFKGPDDGVSWITDGVSWDGVSWITEFDGASWS